MALPKSWEMKRVGSLSPDELMSELLQEVQLLHRRNKELEERVEHLRVSRRVLMNLLERVEKNRVIEIKELERQLAKERSQKRLVRKGNPWEATKLITLDECADDVLTYYSGDPADIAEEVTGVRENGKTARAEFHTEEDSLEKGVERERLKKLSTELQRW